MDNSKKVLYLWDFANTLFPENWNEQLTGFKTIKDYTRAKGVDMNNPRAFEEAYKEPFLKGEMIGLKLAKGYREVLSWTKNNEAFTTGIREQLDWRAEYLNPRVGFDLRDYIQKVVSTFDYGETNVKTREMLMDYLQKKYQAGYKAVVYTDDKLANCEEFRQAAEEVKKSYLDFSYRIYNILNDDQGLRAVKAYWQIGNLYDLMENEKAINN